MKRLALLISLWLAVVPAWADGIAVPLSIPTSGGAFSYPPVSGGASVTWTGYGGSIYTSCAFTSPCTFGGGTPATFNITSGYMVAVVAGDNASSLATNAVSLGGGCSGTLSRIIEDPTSDTNAVATGIFAGTVTGGSSCTITVTAGAAQSFATIGIAYGTLNNLNSTTPGTACSNFYSSAGNPFTCNAALTVSSGGYGISGGFQHNGNATTWTSSNTTIDFQTTTGTYAITISHTTSTISSPGPSFAGFNFGEVIILGAPWR